jgi:hypothetical protein
VTSVVLHLGNLDGTGEHVLLSGTTVEYPVGWSGERLILATGPPFIQNDGESNPYFAGTYRVLDPASPTQNALAVTCPGGQLTGAIVPAGTACVSGSIVRRLDWAGSAPVDLGNATLTGSAVAALPPDGSRAAVATFGEPRPGGPLEIVSSGTMTDTGHSGLAAGWFNSGSLLYVASTSADRSAAVDSIACGESAASFPAATRPNWGPGRSLVITRLSLEPSGPPSGAAGKG